MTLATKSSRALADLHPSLQIAWAWMLTKWIEIHPTLPAPFITQTSRSGADQDADYARGRSLPGKIVTAARAGQSLHGWISEQGGACAFDVAFKDKTGALAWNDSLFSQLGAIGLQAGLGWGGTWHNPDKPHFQPPSYTYEMAAQNIEPTFTPLPDLTR